MRDFVRFPLTAADQATIASTVQAEDVPTTATPGAGQPYPQSLKLTFAAPAALPQVRALFPGSLTFVAAGDAPGTLPDWTVVSRAGYAGYKTVGALLVTMVAGRSLTNAYAEHGSALPVLPNAVWYAPINVTEEFLFETLLNLKGVVSHGGATVPRSSPDWIKHAVAAFLRGSYRPEVRLGGSAADNSVAKRAMPEVRAEAGQVTLYVTMARRETPKDGPSQRFDDLTRELVSTTTEPTSPRHLRNAALPARWVLRGFLPKLVDGAGPVATAVLAGAAPVRYATLRFTRTWLHQVPVAGHPARPLSTASVHLPTQTVEVKGPASAVVHQQRLPAHGIVVLKDPPAQITVAVLGDSRFLSGGPTAWHTAAATAPLTFDLGQTPAPHVIVRRQIPHEMMADTSRPKEHPDCEVSTCTYWSLRRTLRGMVDHYLTGGRLNWETQGAPARPRAVRSALANVVDLLKAAWGNASAMIDGQQHPIWQLMTTHQPSLNVITLEDLRREQRKLLAVLDTLFPIRQDQVRRPRRRGRCSTSSGSRSRTSSKPPPRRRSTPSRTRAEAQSGLRTASASRPITSTPPRSRTRARTFTPTGSQGRCAPGCSPATSCSSGRSSRTSSGSEPDRSPSARNMESSARGTRRCSPTTTLTAGS